MNNYEKSILFIREYALLKPEEEEIYQYGIKNGSFFLIGWLIYLMGAKILECFWSGLLFLMIFYILRIYMGGVHLNTRKQCFVVSTIIITSCFIAIRNEWIDILYYEILGSISLFYMWKDRKEFNSQKIFNFKEKKHFRCMSKKIMLGNVGIIFIFKQMRYIELERAILSAWILVAILLLLEEMIQKKEKLRMKKKRKQLLAGFMAFVMAFTAIPLEGITIEDIFAKEGEETVSADEVPVSEEDVIESENTENSTTFDIGDRKKKVIYYGGDVRYEDEDGSLVDYDPSLVEVAEGTSENGEDLSGYVYENASGDKKQYLPQELGSDTPVRMEYEGHSISFTPLVGNEKKEESVSLDDATEEANDFASIEAVKDPSIREETVTDAYEQEQEKPLTAVYDAGTSMDIEYQSMEDGVKESIVLKEQPATGVFQYEIKTGGLAVRKNSTDEGLTFYDPETERILASMAAPNMNDASGKAYSEELECTLEAKEGEKDTYILTIC